MPDNATTSNPAVAAHAPFDRATIEAVASPIDRLRVIMQRLLDPGGCPWDREQTHATLRQYFIEEVYEACEAIDDEDDHAFAEELGDVALQIVFHSELAERRGAFQLEDVYEHICKKLLDRHPHVFGETHAADSAAVLRNWEQIKQAEKKAKAAKAVERGHKPGGTSALAGVPRALPALQRAGRLQEKAARVGFDWAHPEDVASKVREEIEEFLEHANLPPGAAPENGKRPKPTGERLEAMREEFGDLLFSLVNLSRFLDIPAEEALDAACRKFTRRFMAVEQRAEEQGQHLKDMDLTAMDALWDEVKRTGM